MNEPEAASSDYTQVEFSGQTGEYFRIWIVNIALTIITLGIYSAWATVRKRRYFYTHTTLAGGAFDFHASPKAILIGRLIAVGMIAAYFLSSYLNPFAPFIVLIIVFLLSPLLIVRSRIFRLRNSSFRGIRFNFQPDYAGAFKVYYGSTLLTVFTLGLMTGTAAFMRNRFSVSRSGFGQTPFTFNGQHSEYVSIFFKAVGLGILGVFIAAIFMGLMPPLLDSMEPGQEPDMQKLMIQQYILSIPLFLLYAAIGVYYRIRLQNYMWTKAELGDIKFLSTMSATDMYGIFISNLLAIVLSIGLLTPWAQIRLARYRARHMQVWLTDDWEKYVAADQPEGSALGDEIGEAFDVDVDIGF